MITDQARFCRQSGTPAVWHTGSLAHRQSGTPADWHTGSLANPSMLGSQVSRPSRVLVAH